jgi:alkanesulfonate monooxygenase
MGATSPPEVSWFSGLCDDDYEFLGVPDPALASSWEHCRDIVLTADRHGFDNILLPSGYTLGIDAVAFTSGIAPVVEQIHLLLAVRMGEMWPPQLARQLATIDQMCGGRLTINIISSDLPGAPVDSEPRYQRTREYMRALRALLNGEHLEIDGEFLQLDLEPPRVSTVSGHCPPMYFGGFSPAAKDTAAELCDVFLTWPDTVASVGETVADMRERAAGYGREIRYGLRTHVIVRETEDEARAAADRLLSKLDLDTGEAIRNRSLDTQSAGVSRQNELRDAAGDDGYAEANLWTGIGKARSGAGAAIVGDPDQVLAKLRAYQGVGIDAFVLSGYTLIGECDLFAKYVLPNLEHAPYKPQYEAGLGASA